jgi:hypothetical protein
MQSRKSRQTGAASSSLVPGIVHDVLRSPGKPLDAGTRTFFESRFGRDFSRVRVHADARASASAHDVQASAYTVGQNLVFGAGKYAPETPAGRRLLAHELTHAAQQGAVSPSPALAIGPDQDHHEREADQVSQMAANGTMSLGINPAPPVLQRQLTPAPKEEKKRLPDEQQQSSAASQNRSTGAYLDLIKPTPAEWEQWGVMLQVKQSMADKIAHEYMARHDSAPVEPVTMPSAGKQAASPYKWEPGTAEVPSTVAVTATTYSGGNTPVYVAPPSEARVSSAIFRALGNFKGKGDKLSDWTWNDAPEGGLKSAEEMGMDVAQWSGKTIATTLADEYAKKKIKDLAFRKVVRITVDMLAEDVVATIGVVIGSEVVATLAIGWGVLELIQTLLEPGSLKGAAADDAEIMAGVASYLQQKQAAADRQKNLFSPLQIRIRNPIDKVAVSR